MMKLNKRKKSEGSFKLKETILPASALPISIVCAAVIGLLIIFFMINLL